MLVGCGQEPASPPAVASAEGAKYLLAAEPDGAVDVIKAREEFENEKEIVIVGRIGGSENPWVDGRAAFSIVDVSLKSCDEVGSDKCPKPWDFC